MWVIKCVIVQYLYLTPMMICTFSLQDGATALMKASKEGKVECIKVLLDRRAEVNMWNKVSGVDVNPLPMCRMKNATNLITCV